MTITETKLATVGSKKAVEPNIVNGEILPPAIKRANFDQVAAGHVGVSYTPVLLVFLGITFALGLAWGYVMQKTNSIIGPALFHGAMDITIILGIFSFL